MKKINTESIYCDTELTIDNFKPRLLPNINTSMFGAWVYDHVTKCNIKTFLKKIKPNSNVSFEIMAFNDHDTYMLISTVCKLNSASPIH